MFAMARKIDIAIDIDEDLPLIWALKGHVFYETRDVSNAYKHYIRHLELIPGTKESFRMIPENETKSFVINQIDICAVYRLGRIEKQSECYDQAYCTFLQGIEFGAQNRWIFWYEAGQCAFQIKEYQNTIQCWCLLALTYTKIVKRFNVHCFFFCLLGIDFIYFLI